MFLTLEKCVTYQLLFKEVEVATELNIDLDVVYDKERDDEPAVSVIDSSADTSVDESYRLTGVGDILYQIINILDI